MSVAALVPVSGVAGASASGATIPIQLPAPAAVGQVAETQAAIQTTVDGGPVSLSVLTSSSVTAVHGDGSYVAHSVLDEVEVTNAPASADIRAWGFADLQGLSFDQRYAATGTPLPNNSRSVDARSIIVGMSTARSAVTD